MNKLVPEAQVKSETLSNLTDKWQEYIEATLSKDSPEKFKSFAISLKQKLLPYLIHDQLRIETGRKVQCNLSGIEKTETFDFVISSRKSKTSSAIKINPDVYERKSSKKDFNHEIRNERNLKLSGYSTIPFIESEIINNPESCANSAVNIILQEQDIIPVNHDALSIPEILMNRFWHGESPAEQRIAVLLHTLFLNEVISGKLIIKQQEHLESSYSSRPFRSDYSFRFKNYKRPFSVELDSYSFHREDTEKYIYEMKRERFFMENGYIVIRFGKNELESETLYCFKDILEIMKKYMDENRSLLDGILDNMKKHLLAAGGGYTRKEKLPDKKLEEECIRYSNRIIPYLKEQFTEHRKENKRSHVEWREKEFDLLKQLCDRNYPPEEISDLLQRSKNSVITKSLKKGFTQKSDYINLPPYMQYEDYQKAG